MKKIFILAMALLLTTLFSQNSFAQNKVRDKLNRGLGNLGSFALEIPNELCKNFKESKSVTKKTIETFPALLRGVSKAAVRVLSGIWDISTANLSSPKVSDPMIKPDFPWQKE